MTNACVSLSSLDASSENRHPCMRKQGHGRHEIVAIKILRPIVALLDRYYCLRQPLAVQFAALAPPQWIKVFDQLGRDGGGASHLLFSERRRRGRLAGATAPYIQATQNDEDSAAERA